MKKNILFSLFATIAILLSGCGPTSSPTEEPTTVPSISEPTTNPTTSEPTSTPTSSSTTTSMGEDDVTTEEEIIVDPSTIVVPDQLIIHFKNDEENYDGLVFWLWSDGNEPNHEFEPSGQDENGLYILDDEYSIEIYVTMAINNETYKMERLTSGEINSNFIRLFPFQSSAV